ncbi:MAG: hypothetical protein IJO80_01280, partial [Firmicutes bacterium]|nr:hypothetical protein [Bacillota bacterium]
SPWAACGSPPACGAAADKNRQKHCLYYAGSAFLCLRMVAFFAILLGKLFLRNLAFSRRSSYD